MLKIIYTMTAAGHISGSLPEYAYAWAVGCTGGGTAILHWNGTAWAQVPSPSPGSPSGDCLVGVAATSARNAWAVGTAGNRNFFILRWNGTAWTQVPSPSPGHGDQLTSVAVTSARNAWAVGSGGLILHWNGTAWR